MKNSNMKMAKRLLSFMLVFVIVLVSALPKQVSAASNVSETSQNVTIKVGETKTLKASGFSISWKTSNKNIVAVTSRGVIKGVSEGTAAVTATSKYTGLQDIPEAQPLPIFWRQN